jgi:hypothetical protein
MPSRDVLQRRWLRAPEQDGPEGKVYIPDSGRPSRPRPVLELLPDGSYVDTAVGPTDRGVKRSGRWELAGDTLKLYKGNAREPSRTLQILEATEDRLVIKE